MVISIHTPHVGRDVNNSIKTVAEVRISIHTPRVGSDSNLLKKAVAVSGFQSTRPVWGVTEFLDSTGLPVIISIHTPRVGRDTVLKSNKSKCRISIHTPRVGRDFF